MKPTLLCLMVSSVVNCIRMNIDQEAVLLPLIFVIFWTSSSIDFSNTFHSKVQSSGSLQPSNTNKRNYVYLKVQALKIFITLL